MAKFTNLNTMTQKAPTHTSIFENADSLQQEVKIVSLTKEGTYEVSEMHRHNYFELFYFLEGSGTHQIDFLTHPIESFSIHLVPPGSLHSVSRTADSQGKVLLFTKSFLYSLVDFTPSAHLNLWKASPVFNLTASEITFIELCFSQMEDEFKQNRLEKLKVLGSLMQMIFILLMRQAPRQITTGQGVVDQFFEMLEQNFTATLSAAAYAKKLGVSLNGLNKTLHLSGNSSAKACIIERKILEAKRLLVHSKWSVKETAYYLGYADPNYFSKVFKNVNGTTVSQFLAKNISG